MLQRVVKTERLATAQNTVTTRVLRSLADAAMTLGVPRALLLSAAGLGPEASDHLDQQQSLRSLYALIEACFEHSHDPAFGLHLAEHLPQRAFGGVGDLVFYSATLRESLQTFAKYQALLTDATIFRVHEDASLVQVHCLELTDAPPSVRRCTAELMVAGLRRRILVFRPNAHLHAVSFSYPAPSYRSEYERVFHGQALFGQPFTGLVFDRALLDARSPFEDPELHATLSLYGERKVRNLAQSTSFATRVRQALSQATFPRQADTDSVARSLQVSSRSLRRRLAAEGTSFAALAEETLIARAKDSLLHLDLSIEVTAHNLGFADKGSFHRAFKRWTGMTPQAFRRNA